MRAPGSAGRPRFVLGVLLGLMLTAGGAGTQTVPQDPQQCYRYIDEPPDACSICKDRCLGKGYMCCGIIVLPS